MNSKYNPTEVIYDGKIVLTKEDKCITIDGKITNLFCYTYKLMIEGSVIDNNPISYTDVLGEYRVEAGQFDGLVHIYKIKGNMIKGQVQKVLSTPNRKLEILNFDLINFIEMDGYMGKGKDLPYDVSFLEYQGWSIELKQISTYREVNELLSEYGGYAVTHYGSIRITDNGNFNYDEVSPILEKLFSYLAFICGRRIYPARYHGVYAGSIVFSRYESKLIDPWNNLNTWYPKNERVLKQNLFEGFNSIWSKPSWSKNKSILLGTYLECFTNVTIENRISSIQIALELISKIYLVDTVKELSTSKFKKLSTRDRFNVLLQSLEIPLEEPRRYLSEVSIDDPIHFFVQVRNSIVHSKTSIDLTHAILSKAYFIGLWLLELCLLKLFNYQGRYKNRLSDNKWHGDSENGGCYFIVPWDCC